MSAFSILTDSIIKRAVGLPDLNITATVKIGSFKLENKRVVALTERENYISDLFATGMVSIAMSPSEYTKAVLVGHEDMEVFITRTPLVGGESITKAYRAIINKWEDVRMEGNVKDVNTAGNLDSMNISVIDFELYDLPSFDLRLYEFGRIFQHATAIDCLKYLLSTCMLKDTYRIQDYVGRITADRGSLAEKYSTITVPDGTSMFELVDFLQDRYGIYNQGIGCFLKNGGWSIFAPYSLAKYSEDIKKLTIVNIPATTKRGANRNFIVEGNMTTVLATGDTKSLKLSDAEALNQGTGTRYIDPRKLMGGMSTSDPANNKPKMTPENYLTEYNAVSYGNPLKLVKTVSGRMSSNPAKQASELAARGGMYVNVVWENGVLELLVPNMPVRYLYEVDGVVKEIRGTLLAATAFTSNTNGGIVDTLMKTNVGLSLFLKEL